MHLREIQKVLRDKCVGIAGCGGLGSNAAVALARVGVGRLVIADFDTVEEVNLNRQYFFRDQIGIEKPIALRDTIRRICPSIVVDTHVVEMLEKNIAELFAPCDVILEAFDKAETKEMLIRTVLTEFPDIPLIAGVGVAGWGGNELIETTTYGNLYLVGDGVSETIEEDPPLAPRVGVVSNMMANIALELLLGKDVCHENSVK